MSTTQQKPPPRDYTGSLGGTAQRQQQQPPDNQDTLLNFDGGDTHQPPWFVFLLAWIGIGTGFGANALQVYTSNISFHLMIVSDSVYQSMGKAGQAAAEATIQLISFGMSFVFQLGLMFFVFRVKQEFKNTKTQTGAQGMQAVKYTAVAMVDQQKLLLLWTALAFIADTLGDYTFITIYVNSWFVIFMYAAALYAASTILLSRALEKQWAASIAFANWKAYKLYIKIMEMKLHNQ